MWKNNRSLLMKSSVQYGHAKCLVSWADMQWEFSTCGDENTNGHSLQANLFCGWVRMLAKYNDQVLNFWWHKRHRCSTFSWGGKQKLECIWVLCLPSSADVTETKWHLLRLNLTVVSASMIVELLSWVAKIITIRHLAIKLLQLMFVLMVLLHNSQQAACFSAIWTTG